MLVVAYQFVATAMRFGAENANMGLVLILILLMWFGAYILGTLGNFRILKVKNEAESD